MPEAWDRLAVGIAIGSQAHGNDDEISRDHGWGPGFSVWLSSEDFDPLGQRLQEVLDQLPRTFQGYSWLKGVKRTCSVLELDEYLTKLVGYRCHDRFFVQ